MSYEVKKHLLKNRWIIVVALILLILNFSTIERIIFFDNYDHLNRKHLQDNESKLQQQCFDLNYKYTKESTTNLKHRITHEKIDGFFSDTYPVFKMSFRLSNPNYHTHLHCSATSVGGYTEHQKFNFILYYTGKDEILTESYYRSIRDPAVCSDYRPLKSISESSCT